MWCCLVMFCDWLCVFVCALFDVVRCLFVFVVVRGVLFVVYSSFVCVRCSLLAVCKYLFACCLLLVLNMWCLVYVV